MSVCSLKQSREATEAQTASGDGGGGSVRDGDGDGDGDGRCGDGFRIVAAS